MSLEIDVAKVRSVLLPNAGWLDIKLGSFKLDAYEFHAERTVVHSRGEGGFCSTGFQFQDQSGNVVTGPLTSILAIRLRE
jgi:hypothetical protein